jgi:hypothetical protein
MTNAEQRTAELARQAVSVGMNDYAAGGLSASIRATMSTKSKTELLAIATQLGLTTNPRFII